MPQASKKERKKERKKQHSTFQRGRREKGTAKRIPEATEKEQQAHSERRKEGGREAMPQASRAEKDGLGWTGVKKRRREGDKNGNLFERSEFISVQPDRRRFSPFRRSLDFSFCELYLFIKEKKKWTPNFGRKGKKVDPNLWEKGKY